MFEINNLRAKVLALDANTITVNIDTTNFSEFVIPVDYVTVPPVCVPVGSGIDYSTPFLVHTILDDAFDNVRV